MPAAFSLTKRRHEWATRGRKPGTRDRWVSHHDKDHRYCPPLAVPNERRQVGSNIFRLSHTTAEHYRPQDRTASDLATYLPARRRASHRLGLQRRAAEPSGLVSKLAGKPAGEHPIRGPDPDDDCTHSGGGGESMAVVACSRRVPGVRGVSTEDRPSDTGRSAATGDLNLRKALRRGISGLPRTRLVGSSGSETRQYRKLVS